MPAGILTGKELKDSIKKSLKREIGLHRLKIAILRIGDNYSSDIYFTALRRLGSELGVGCVMEILKKSASQRMAEQAVDRLNADKSVSGIMVHVPAPRHIDLRRLVNRISPLKDVEGMSANNMAGLFYNNWAVAPCTAASCMALIDSTGIDLRGREAVIIGHSEIIGKPLALMLLGRMATVTVCHIGTYEKGMLKEHVKRAQILVSSVGKPGLIRGSWIRKGAIVVDVGISRDKVGRLKGDVQFDTAFKRASYITPVPGGVGPLTQIMVMKNLVALQRKA